MNKRGFTLVELLGVITILAILALIVFPIVTNQLRSSKLQLTESTEKLFYTANNLYLDENQNQYAYIQGDIYCVTLKTLLESGKLQRPLLDSNGKELDLNYYVQTTVLKDQDKTFAFVKTCSENNQGSSIPDEPIIPPSSDVTPPTIASTGPNAILTTATSFNALDGIVVSDDFSPTSKIKIEVTGTVTLGTVGSYSLTYKAMDETGNYATLTRVVKVVPGTYTYAYTGNSQTFVAPAKGKYKIELWGAQGSLSQSKGAYTSGEIILTEDTNLYVYVGQGLVPTTDATSFNGGTGNSGGYPGGGATDVRLDYGTWNNAVGLRSRIMVAAGSGSGTGNNTVNLGYGGTLVGGSGGGTAGGTQISAGAAQLSNYTASGFGVANGGCAGGGGYYGGGGSSCANGGGGGSSFISGQSGCIAIKSATDQTPKVTTYSKIEDSYHYSGYVFTNPVMKSGIEVMPNGAGTGTITGNTGNGYAKITILSFL